MPKRSSETAAIQSLVDNMKRQHQRAPLNMKLNPLASTEDQLSTGEMLAREDAKFTRLTELDAPTDARRVQKIAVDLIDDSPYQPRLKYEKDVIESYAESIKANGQIDPIKIRQKANGRYEQLDGHCRLRSIRDILGWEFIDGIIHDVNDETARAYVMTYTTARTDISSFERALMYQSAIKGGIKASDLARSLGVSRAHISQCMVFTKLPDKFQEVLKSHPRLMSYRGADALIALIAETPEQVDLIFTGFKKSVDKHTAELMKAKDSVMDADEVQTENYEISAASLRAWLHKRQKTTVKTEKPRSRFITDSNGANVIELKNGARPGEILIRCHATDRVSNADIEEAVFELLRTRFIEPSDKKD